MNICIILPYANPHDTGWLDEFISISNHNITIGIINNVKKYRNNHFEEADQKKGYLYFFKGIQYKKLFYEHVSNCDCLITLGIFENWFLKIIFSAPKLKNIYVLTEPLRPGYQKKLLVRKLYISVIKIIKGDGKFSFLCMGGILVKKQYLSFGFTKSKFYRFGHFPLLHQQKKEIINGNIQIIKFIFVGQLIPRKGIDTLIFLINYLKKKYTNWEFSIVGNGILKKELLQNCTEERRVQYIENIEDRAIMKSQFDRSHILFLPSYFDGWGAVVNEAISSSCSLLLSEKVYAGVELLKDERNGFSFNPHNREELYSKVDRYFSNPKILDDHFKESEKIFNEWNYKNAAWSFDNMLTGNDNSRNKTLLKII